MLSITSILPAQDVQESTQKKVTIGVDVLPLIGGFANAQFGFLHNNGKNEVSILLALLVKSQMKTWVSLVFGRHIDYIQLVKES